jgi:hypothetical protein
MNAEVASRSTDRKSVLAVLVNAVCILELEHPLAEDELDAGTKEYRSCRHASSPSSRAYDTQDPTQLSRALDQER